MKIKKSKMWKSLKIVSIITLVLSTVSCSKEDPSPEAITKVSNGYVLYSIMGDLTTHLIDTSGIDVKTWTSAYHAMGSCYLSENKTLLRSGETPNAKTGTFTSGGAVTGIIEELDNNSNVIWSIQKDDDDCTLHHDFKEIDQNTIIALAWELVAYNSSNYWNERVIIIDKPTNTITWEWSALTDGGITPNTSDKEDYIHFNSVDYKNGSILVSARSKNTIYLIDKESKAIVSSFTGGGILSGQHDASFLDNGNILVFNNNAGDNTSAVIEMNSSDEVVWEYSDNFYSTSISGAQRLESGNTLICSGNEARFIEVTSDGESVWEFTPDNSNPNHTNAIFKVREYSEY